MSDQLDPMLSAAMRRVFAEHPRLWRDFSLVYPVVSRRAKGLSIGINLNPDKVCNFNCVYCCVDRTIAPVLREVDLGLLRDELQSMLTITTSGEIWRHEEFREVEPAYRRINDLALSGDGEPTTYPLFEEAVRLTAEMKQRFGLEDAKIILITNATMFDRPRVQRGLAILDENNGEVWAKLDAGTQAYYEIIDRSKVPFEKIMGNIAECGRQRPIVIQSLFVKMHNQSVPHSEFEAYLNRLAELLEAGCQIKFVQLYTIARRPADPSAAALSGAELEHLLLCLRERLPKLRAEAYYSPMG
jgi:wyosine [tRNA(Phe)-imidazoG37] synthetase (radical SAM superfamily)